MFNAQWHLIVFNCLEKALCNKCIFVANVSVNPIEVLTLYFEETRRSVMLRYDGS